MRFSVNFLSPFCVFAKVALNFSVNFRHINPKKIFAKISLHFFISTMKTNQKWHQVRIITKLNCWEPTEPALPRSWFRPSLPLMAESDYTPHFLEFKINARARWVMIDFLAKNGFALRCAKKQLFFEQKICMKSNKITRQNNFAYKYAKLLKKFLVLEL